MNRILATALAAMLVAACAPAVTPSAPPAPSDVAVVPTEVTPTGGSPATQPPVTIAPTPTSEPSSTPSPTVAPTPRPIPTPAATAPPTATTPPTATPAATPTRTPTATPQDSPTPSPTPDPSPSPTPRPDEDRVLLGRWTTRFTPSPLNGGGANIRVPAKRIDGTIVKPGQMFQFLDAIRPVTSPPYAMGGVLRNGRIVENGALGGGMCSASTTLFNAAMRAGLRIVERHAHSLYISRYPVGLDATVYSTGRRDGQDVKFINDTGHRLLIRAFGGRRKVTFEIWGIDDGRTVKVHKPIIENRRPGVDYIEFTDDLAPGERHRVADVYDGYESWVTRSVRDRAGNVISRDTWHSRYRSAYGLVEVGRRPDDPPAGTRIPADEYHP